VEHNNNTWRQKYYYRHRSKNHHQTLPKTTNSVKNNGVKAGLADISQSLNTNQDNNETILVFIFHGSGNNCNFSRNLLFIKLKFQKTMSGHSHAKTVMATKTANDAKREKYIPNMAD